jgi:hypothetical protein
MRAFTLMLWNPVWLDDWLGIGLGLLQKNETTVTFIAGSIRQRRSF